MLRNNKTAGIDHVLSIKGKYSEVMYLRSS